MPKDKQRRRALPGPIHHGGPGRLAVILVFAIVGAVLLGSIAEPTLRFLYTQLAVKLNRVENPAATLKAFPWYPVLSIIPFAVLGGLLGGGIGLRIVRSFERVGIRWDQMEAGDKVTLFVGIFAGLLASVPLLLLFQALPNLDPFARVVLITAVTLGLSALSVYALQTMSDILPWNRGRGPMRRSGVKILDTNVIIDGRIYDVAKTGFLDGQMYVPGFVLEELQYIADSHDPLRRQRGRRGLETLRHMQAEFTMEVRIHDRLAPEQGDGVDARLVRQAKALGGDIVTNDFNLRRVAELQGVHVLSLNDLALALRPNVLPQETLELAIIREGNQPGQGVGYLEDGTMVVVENGKPHIGETSEIIVTQVIQTERGKMIFGEIPEDEEPPHEFAIRPRQPRPRK
ncbi:MAG TPA: PIN domain-containing protein [Fimbriimonas sp.]|nr:PIN domain-containing protein [Fimbriimonas sp.]